PALLSELWVALVRQLKPLESAERLLDPRLPVRACAALGALAHPAPFLQQQLLVLPVGLEINRSDDVVADQNRQREIAELALVPGHIGLEAVLVVEHEMRALALDHQRIEGREDVHEIRRGFASLLQGRRTCPVLLLASAFDRERDQLATTDARLDQAAHARLARGIEMADRIERHHTLRTQRTVQQIGCDLALRRRLRRPLPAE